MKNIVPIKKLEDGNEIPMLGLGTWQQTDESKCINTIKEALKIGYRHIDTADVYGNHKYIAKGIKDFDRSKLFITTKLWIELLDPKKVESICDRYLMELDTDYIDLFLIHWPNRGSPLLDVTYEMTKLKEKGKVKSVGVSNYTIHHLQDLIDQKLHVAVNQVEYHPFLNQEDLLKFCEKNAIAVTAYCPLARGIILKDPNILNMAKKYRKSPSQISLRWLIQKDIIVIPKASSHEHLKENFEIFDFEISQEDMLVIDNIGKVKRKRIIDPDIGDFDY